MGQSQRHHLYTLAVLRNSLILINSDTQPHAKSEDLLALMGVVSVLMRRCVTLPPGISGPR